MQPRHHHTKSALLIGSSYLGLRGPTNDVQLMRQVLGALGFQITACVGAEATRKGILEAWEKIIAESRWEDTVVIYYSGHGGRVMSETPDRDVVSAARMPGSFQFIYPVDFSSDDDDRHGKGEKARGESDSEEMEFRGILDFELTWYLRRTTDVTKNVTIIIDSCHSGRICRLPQPGQGVGDLAIARGLPEITHRGLSRHIENLRRKEMMPPDLADQGLNGGNPHAVRIFASMEMEVAFEMMDPASGLVCGFLTKHLARSIAEIAEKGKNGRVSWAKTMMGLREVIGLESQGVQHPIVDGPIGRYHFSLDWEPAGANTGYILKIEDGEPTLLAGSVAGVRTGDVFALIPFGSSGAHRANEIELGRATVTGTSGFRAAVDVVGLDPNSIGNGLMAFRRKVALVRWPVEIPSDHCAPGLAKLIQKSKYIRKRERHDTTCLCSIQQEGERLVLYSRGKVMLAEKPAARGRIIPPKEDYDELVKAADQLAWAQHIRHLACEDDDEKLRHKIRVTFGTASGGKPARTIATDGTGLVSEGDHVYLSLRNDGRHAVYVSIFDVNVRGIVTFLPRSDDSDGVEVDSGRIRTIGAARHGKIKGLPVTWPTGISRVREIEETFVVILTSQPVNLQHLGSRSEVEKASRGAMETKKLNLLVQAAQLATANTRDVDSDTSAADILYDVMHIPFTLVPAKASSSGTARNVASARSDLPMPDSQKDGEYVAWNAIPSPMTTSLVDEETTPEYPYWYLMQSSRGTLSSLARKFKHVPPYVWVVNQHSEEITVIVSKYKPRRILTGFSLDGHVTGGGVSFDNTTFQSPATRKTLEACAAVGGDSEGPMARFPLWTREEGFGVITILVGKEMKPYIENDEITLGATAYFQHKPDMKIRDYAGAWLPTSGNHAYGRS